MSSLMCENTKQSARVCSLKCTNKCVCVRSVDTKLSYRHIFIHLSVLATVGDCSILLSFFFFDRCVLRYKNYFKRQKMKSFTILNHYTHPEAALGGRLNDELQKSCFQIKSL